MSFPVAFSSETLSGTGLAQNVSREGCMVENGSIVPAGSYIELSVSVPDQNAPVRIDLAAIRWADQRLIGIELLYMRPLEYERLNCLLEDLQRQEGR